MRRFFLLLLVYGCSLFAADVDFDYVFIGSSPISVLEGLYRSYTGSKVLIVEASPTLGGAWKSITICGVAHVDMGCHQIGSDPKLKKFLETYVGCSLVQMNNPYGQTNALQSADSGLYFSGGCYELNCRLLELIDKSPAQLLLNCKLEKMHINFDDSVAVIKIQDSYYTTSKIVMTPNSYIEIENCPKAPKPSYSKYYHLYLLIEDSSPPRFTYFHGFCKGMSRAINLTPFSLEMPEEGQQLIAIQTYDEQSLSYATFYFDELKKRQFISQNARLITSDQYIYEQPHFHLSSIQSTCPQAHSFFEILRTDAIWNISQHTDKWEKAFTPCMTH